MADIIKVKAKKNYDWNQDSKYIYVNISLSVNTTMKKIQIYLSDVILRVTSLEKKFTHVLDLLHEVDYKSPDNKFKLIDGILHVILKKINPNQQWNKLLIEDISLADLKVRRRQSQARYEQVKEKIEKNKEHLRHENDRKATQQLMKFEELERNKLEERKQRQKNMAIEDVFGSFNDRTGQIVQKKQKIIKKNKQISYQQNKWKQKQQNALQILQQEQQQQQQKINQEIIKKNRQKMMQNIKKNVTKYDKNTIFTQEDTQQFKHIENQEYEEIPVRQTNTVKVNFTQKIYPGVAARDTFYNQPPMPKNKKIKGSSGKDADNKNPLWLKDKGDKFYSYKNYASAVQAYTEAIKIDSKMLKAYQNRSITYMKMFQIVEALNDCEQCLTLLQGQIVGQNQNEREQSLKVICKIKIRKAICTAWKGNLSAAKICLEEILEMQGDTNIQQTAKDCLQKIKKRQNSIAIKLKGDELLKLKKYQECLKPYNQSIDIDNNQYAISNKSLALNKLQMYNQTCNICDKGINKLNEFGIQLQQNKQNKDTKLLLIKILYRKSIALQKINKIQQSKQIIKKGLYLDTQNIQFKKLNKQIQNKQNKIKLKQLQQQAIRNIKQFKYKQCLQIYQKCLKLLQNYNDINQYLNILQNQCVCYLKLQNFNSIILCCIRILKIIKNQQNKIISFNSSKSININKDQLNKISVRTLMRKANAYIKTGQIYNAKADLEQALDISPNHPTILKQLNQLKKQIGL